jgi:hypothetical protein
MIILDWIVTTGAPKEMFQERQDSHQIFLNVTLEPFKVSFTEANTVGLLKGGNPVLMGFIFGEFFIVKCPGVGGVLLVTLPSLPLPFRYRRC